MTCRSTSASLLLQTICCVQLTVAIMNQATINEEHALSSRERQGSSYLNQQRPLWILQDQVQQNDYTEYNCTRESHHSYQAQQPQTRYRAMQLGATQRERHLNFAPKQQQFKRAKYESRERPQRPLQRLRTYKHMTRLTPSSQHHHHQPLRRMNLPYRLTYRQPSFKGQTRTHRRTHYIPSFSMPTFDSLPGDESLGEAPVFIYTGPKGAIILNTMLSAPTYPMQEPVPGQILYPPNVPIFRPNPIVERFRMPGSTQILNLTLIPFYAHEAVGAPSMSRIFQQESALNQETTNAQPSVVYGAPAVMLRPSGSADTESTPRALKWRMKKSKHYSAYHSLNDVQWTPMSPDELSFSTATTTPFPLTAPSPPQNHRAITSTTPTLFDNYKITHESDTESAENVVDRVELVASDNRLGVIYVDESLEKPTTSAVTPPKVSSHYSLSKEFYAFPVFTLGKLLKKESTETEQPVTVENTVDSPLTHESMQGEEHVTQSVVDSGGAAEENAEGDAHDMETWFILNSRYKGQRSEKTEYRLSSKYVHSTDQGEQNGVQSSKEF